MTQVSTQSKFRIPTIKDIVEDTDVTIRQNALMVLLNQPPPAEWVATHPYIKGYKYLPIGRIEYLLKRIFTKYKIEVIKTGILFNAVECTVRVWFRDPISGEMEFHDGVGACELQTQKDSGTLKIDFSNVNKSAVEMALPIAKSKAIKDACDHFGRLFGSDLNHKEQFDFTSLLKQQIALEDLEMLFEMKKEFLSNEDRINGERIISTREEVSYQKLFNQLKNL